MISSKSKKSFAIDDLLCNTNTEDQRPTRAPNTIQSSYNTINGNSTVHSDLYLANGNRIGLLSQQIDHLNSFNFHHYPNWPAPHMVLPNTFNSSKFLTLNLTINISFHLEYSEIVRTFQTL